jgi:ABC-2 type transport system permease protein
MNVRGCLALAKITASTWLVQRSFFFLLAFGWMISPLIYLFVWATAASGQSVGGFSQGEFVAYYLVLIATNQFTMTQANWTLGDLIREGLFNGVLLRPMAPFLDTLASELAGKAVFMLFVLPVVGLLALLMKPEFHLTMTAVILFIPALILAWLLRYIWGYSLALLAFWATRADGLLAVQDSLLFLLAGQVAPVMLLPGLIREVAVILPFRYMLGFPVEVLTTPMSHAALIQGFAIQAGWLMLAVFAARMIWRAGIQRYEAVGG